MSKWSAMIKDALPDEANASPIQPEHNEVAGSYSVTSKRHNLHEAASQADTQNNNAVVYPPHPIAVALLLACCQRIEASRDELVTELLKLKDSSPQEQIRRWALACSENGVPPVSVILPAAPSNGKAYDNCMTCKHLEMILAARNGGQKQYHWSCAKQHAILEASYLGERVLLAPGTCHDHLLSNAVKQ